MKKMQDFSEWLFVPIETYTPIQHRLAALTHFSRNQLNSLVQFDPWYIWQAETQQLVTG